jgi:hypothetical protein
MFCICKVYRPDRYTIVYTDDFFERSALPAKRTDVCNCYIAESLLSSGMQIRVSIVCDTFYDAFGNNWKISGYCITDTLKEHVVV